VTVRKGEHGSLVVYADRFTKTETDDKGAAIEREIPFMKGSSQKTETIVR